MESSGKSFRQCVPPCKSYLTPKDSYELCVIWFGVEHTHSALGGAGFAHCDKLRVRKLH